MKDNPAAALVGTWQPLSVQLEMADTGERVDLLGPSPTGRLIMSRLQGLTRDLKTPLVVSDAIVSSINGAPSAERKALLGRLQDQGETSLKGRSGAVRIWTRGTVE